MTQRDITFIGGGNMARSLIGGLIQRGTPAARIAVSEPQAALREALRGDFGVAVYAHSDEAVVTAPVWLLAVKPQVMRQVCEALAPLARQQRPLLISIAAGTTTSAIAEWLGYSAAVVRAMPNTPALLGCGATGLFANAAVSEAQRGSAAATLGAVGITEWIASESLMDAVTATSGSGPAYLFLLAEAMQQAAAGLGLPEATARALVNQTLLGAARMLVESDEPAAVLRQRVTSPGGTTQAAVERFEADGFRELVAAALGAAEQRGRELAGD
jgi:pyrroline-5-carboxylate reductase